jgi:branched-chain amino acid transport system ATP-binding protein
VTASALEFRDVSAAYGPFNALFGVTLRVAPGEAVALLGANGAGKTTVARVASGLLRPTAGGVLVAGQDLTGSPAHRFARSGVVHAPEGRSVFGSLTTDENLRLAFRRSRGRRGVGAALEQVYERFPTLARRRRQLASTLSGGEQRMLSLARALAEDADVLVADELSLGLAPIVIDQIYAELVRLRESGTSLLIVEQQVGPALALCDRVVLLEHGAVAWEGGAADAHERVTAGLPGAAG